MGICLLNIFLSLHLAFAKQLEILKFFGLFFELRMRTLHQAHLNTLDNNQQKHLIQVQHQGGSSKSFTNEVFEIIF